MRRFSICYRATIISPAKRFYLEHKFVEGGYPWVEDSRSDWRKILKVQRLYLQWHWPCRRHSWRLCDVMDNSEESWAGNWLFKKRHLKSWRLFCQTTTWLVSKIKGSSWRPYLLKPTRELKNPKYKQPVGTIEMVIKLALLLLNEGSKKRSVKDNRLGHSNATSEEAMAVEAGASVSLLRCVLHREPWLRPSCWKSDCRWSSRVLQRSIAKDTSASVLITDRMSAGGPDYVRRTFCYCWNGTARPKKVW